MKDTSGALYAQEVATMAMATTEAAEPRERTITSMVFISADGNKRAILEFILLEPEEVARPGWRSYPLTPELWLAVRLVF
jgi:hypothetical protein